MTSREIKVTFAQAIQNSIQNLRIILVERPGFGLSRLNPGIEHSY
jgi:hypothetical protein